MTELRNDELEKVTGGGHGSIPQGGITFERYTTLLAGYYYSQAQNTNEVVYVYESSQGLGYTREAFNIDPSTNTWISRNRTPSGSVLIIYNIEGFKESHPYRLNVQPQ